MLTSKNNESGINKIFKTKWFTLEAVRFNSGVIEPYYRISSCDSVEILAITPDKKIILVRQFRPALKDYFLEFPSGYVDKQEDVISTAKRELFEETSYVCDSIVKIGSFKISPSRINNTLHAFLGTGAKINGTKKEKGIEVKLFSEKKVLKLIDNGEFVETAGIAIFLLAKYKGLL